MILFLLLLLLLKVHVVMTIIRLKSKIILQTPSSLVIIFIDLNHQIIIIIIKLLSLYFSNHLPIDTVGAGCKCNR
jgi:hypothetical protein